MSTPEGWRPSDETLERMARAFDEAWAGGKSGRGQALYEWSVYDRQTEPIPSRRWRDHRVAAMRAAVGTLFPADASQSAEVERVGLEQGIAAVRCAMACSSLDDAKVWAQVALDFLTNDEAALAEGATYAASETEGG